MTYEERKARFGYVGLRVGLNGAFAPPSYHWRPVWRFHGRPVVFVQERPSLGAKTQEDTSCQTSSVAPPFTVYWGDVAALACVYTRKTCSALG